MAWVSSPPVPMMLNRNFVPLLGCLKKRKPHRFESSGAFDDSDNMGDQPNRASGVPGSRPDTGRSATDR
jgi:hypothetical protein